MSGSAHSGENAQTPDVPVAAESALRLSELELRHRKPVQYTIKRAFDVVAATLGLVVLSPLLLAIAIATRLTSNGAVLYRQRRLKRDGEVFTLLKFRTMVRGADERLEDVFHLNEASGPLFKSRQDPRITPVGRALRRAYLDELPQLLNVLKGDMSLVGPRPCLAHEADKYHTEMAFRFTVPQGMTGPWQTNGHHGIGFEEHLRVERTYVESWSLTLDLKILARTIPLVFRRTGA